MASGGHSHIVEVQDYTHYHILGHTVDDAAGEAFDKVARTLGLPYPGGPSVANAAKTGDPKATVCRCLMWRASTTSASPASRPPC